MLTIFSVEGAKKCVHVAFDFGLVTRDGAQVPPLGSDLSEQTILILSPGQTQFKQCRYKDQDFFYEKIRDKVNEKILKISTHTRSTRWSGFEYFMNCLSHVGPVNFMNNRFGRRVKLRRNMGKKQMKEDDRDSDKNSFVRKRIMISDSSSGITRQEIVDDWGTSGSFKLILRQEARIHKNFTLDQAILSLSSLEIFLFVAYCTFFTRKGMLVIFWDQVLMCACTVFHATRFQLQQKIHQIKQYILDALEKPSYFFSMIFDPTFKISLGNKYKEFIIDYCNHPVDHLYAKSSKFHFYLKKVFIMAIFFEISRIKLFHEILLLLLPMLKVSGFPSSH
ncbi:hypothetical protein VP01_470g1 [Puccinia sorghi]|uniref:Uncharacterized protein n=1 Tax=Puccinia sorghi TaxID=27349 RepID=A0A0L6UN05_9BASI|nr:hypothetical protein VP01_470g1 [Puccinia sorghi]